MKTLLTLLAVLCVMATTSCKTAAPRAASPLSAEKFNCTLTRNVQTKYLLYLPPDCAAVPGQRWPLLLFLHGAGERGDDLALVARHGPLKLVRQGTNFPFIIIAPQCPKGQHWDNDVLTALLDRVVKQYAVDESRIYLTGLSMGGFGTWSLGAAHPERFAALAPVCGGGETISITLAQHFDPAKLAQMKAMGVWAFHGGKDPTVLTDESERMVNTLKKAGCQDVKLTIYPEAKHDSWTETYANPKFYEWLLSHARSK